MNTQRISVTDAEPGVSFHVAIRHEKQLCPPVGQPPGQPMNHRRILIVDDETGVTRSLKLNLEATAGYEVRTENDSTRAIDAAHEFHPQLILLDVLMPRPDGCEVAARIHADPELKDTPIVFLTALANNEHTAGHAVVAGSTVYLAKPVETEELIKCIEQILSPTGQP